MKHNSQVDEMHITPLWENIRFTRNWIYMPLQNTL